MIRKGIIERFYEAASIQRWNDHVRPVELTELGKQAHKMVIAYVLARLEEARGSKINWTYLIEGGLFEFLHRVILTDIKPPVFHQMMRQKGKELNDWVFNELDRDISDIKGDFKTKLQQYFLVETPADYHLERRILKAAHYLATKWEFQIIYNISPFLYGIEKTRSEIEDQVEDYYDLAGVQQLLLDKKLYGFIDLCGQLRFQQRWAQSPRIPKTSVLDHMLIVALLSYLCSLEVDACEKRLYNNYFAGLFHDLPEVLTRDIVSPIKSSVAGLQDLIKEYEGIQIRERILPLLPVTWHEEIHYFVEDEFSNKIKIGGQVRKGIDEAEMGSYNENHYAALDGHILKACDHLAAFIEATLSIEQGIKSHHLEDGQNRLYQMYRNKTVGGINFGQLFDYFR